MTTTNETMTQWGMDCRIISIATMCAAGHPSTLFLVCHGPCGACHGHALDGMRVISACVTRALQKGDFMENRDKYLDSNTPTTEETTPADFFAPENVQRLIARATTGAH